MVKVGKDLANIQVTANQLLTVFLHARRPPRGDFWLSRLSLLGGGCSESGSFAGHVTLAWPAIAENLAHAFQRLGERLSPSAVRDGDSQSICVGPAQLDRSARHNDLRKRFAQLWDQCLERYASGLYLHGSLATRDDKPYSDCDALIVLRDESVTNTTKLLALRRALVRSQWILKAFDPYQHHGYFVITQSDFQAYPEPFLPIAALRVAACVAGDRQFSVRPRVAHDQALLAFRTLAASVAAQEQEDLSRWTGHRAKSFLSRLMLLPALLLGARRQYVYKRESFALARPLFSETEWSCMEWATRVRAAWPSDTTFLRCSRWLARRGHWPAIGGEWLGRAGLDPVSALRIPELETRFVARACRFARRCLDLVSQADAGAEV